MRGAFTDLLPGALEAGDEGVGGGVVPAMAGGFEEGIPASCDDLVEADDGFEAIAVEWEAFDGEFGAEILELYSDSIIEGCEAVLPSEV